MANKEQSKELQQMCSISIPSIIAALHSKAISEVKDKTLTIANSAIEEDGKTVKLQSAGEHIVSAIPAKDRKEPVTKEAAIAALKQYVTWFVGPDLANKVDKKTVLPLGGGKDKNESMKFQIPTFIEFITEASSSGDGADSSGKKSKTDGADKGGTGDGSDKGNKSDGSSDSNGKKSSTDGADSSGNKSSTDGADSKSTGDGQDAGSKSDDTDGADAGDEGNGADAGGKSDPEDGADGGDGGNKDGKSDPDESENGYYIAYNLKVEGLKQTALKDAMKKFAAKFFDDMTITADGLFGGGQSFTVKDVKDAVKDALGGIKPEELVSKIRDAIDSKFPDLNGVSVECRDNDTLLKELNSKLTPDQKSTLRGARFSITIQCTEESQEKPFLNTRNVADIVTSSIKGILKKFKNSVTKDDVIYIENYVDTTKNQDAIKKLEASVPVPDEIIQLIGDEWETGSKHARKVYVSLERILDNKIGRNDHAKQSNLAKSIIDIWNKFKSDNNPQGDSASQIPYKKYKDFIKQYTDVYNKYNSDTAHSDVDSSSSSSDSGDDDSGDSSFDGYMTGDMDNESMPAFILSTNQIKKLILESLFSDEDSQEQDIDISLVQEIARQQLQQSSIFRNRFKSLECSSSNSIQTKMIDKYSRLQQKFNDAGIEDSSTILFIEFYNAGHLNESFKSKIYSSLVQNLFESLDIETSQMHSAAQNEQTIDSESIRLAIEQILQNYNEQESSSINCNRILKMMSDDGQTIAFSALLLEETGLSEKDEESKKKDEDKEKEEKEAKEKEAKEKEEAARKEKQNAEDIKAAEEFDKKIEARVKKQMSLTKKKNTGVNLYVIPMKGINSKDDYDEDL